MRFQYQNKYHLSDGGSRPIKLRMTAETSASKHARLVANMGELASFNRRAAQHERGLAEGRNYSPVKAKVNHFFLQRDPQA